MIGGKRMEYRKKYLCWKMKDDGVLFFDRAFGSWAFARGLRKIFITPWRDTSKGPITQIIMREKGKEIIIEIVEKDFDEELFSPKQLSESVEHLMEYIEILFEEIQMHDTTEHMISSLYLCVKRITQKLWRIKEVHVYCGKVSFGMKKNFGKIKNIKSIPDKAM